MSKSSKKVQVGSAWLLTIVVAMFAITVFHPTPALAQPASNLPPVCGALVSPVHVHLEHDTPLRMVAAAVWEGHDEAQASAFLNNTCGAPTPRALNILPGQELGEDGMSLRAVSEARRTLFRTNVAGTSFLSAAQIVCATGNEGAFEARYQLIRHIPVDTVVSEDGGVPTGDVGFIREVERDRLTIDCTHVRAHPTSPRRWFHESVPNGASIYIGARGGHDIVLPRGGIARPTESACRALATLVADPTDEAAIRALRVAIEDVEPVELTVRAFAVDRIADIAIALARRLHERDAAAAHTTEQLGNARTEIRRLGNANGTQRDVARSLQGTIDTLKELPTWLGLALVIVCFFFGIFASWAFSAINKLVRAQRLMQDSRKIAVAKAEHEARVEERREISLSVKNNGRADFNGFPSLMAWTNVESQIVAAKQQTADYYEKTAIPALREEYGIRLEAAHHWADTLAGLVSSFAGSILPLLPANDVRRITSPTNVVAIDTLGKTAIHAFPDAIATIVARKAATDQATIANLTEELAVARERVSGYNGSILIASINGLGASIANELLPSNPLRARLMEENQESQTLGAVADAFNERTMELESLRHEIGASAKKTQALETAHHKKLTEIVGALGEMETRLDEAVASRSATFGDMFNDETKVTVALQPSSLFDPIDMIHRVNDRAVIIIGLLAATNKPPSGELTSTPGASSAFKSVADARVRSRDDAPDPFVIATEENPLIVENGLGGYRMKRPEEIDDTNK